MKKLILSAVVLLFFVVAQAQSEVVVPATEVATATETAVAVQDKKTEVKYEDLPQAVRTTLAGEAYKDWEVVKAWHNVDKDQYEIEVKNASTETKTLKFNKEGKEITQ